MEPTVSQIDFEELELPDLVYKYRKWSDPNHKTILSDQIVFMSSPSDFEDPKDCKSQKRYDLLTDKEIYTYYLNHHKTKYPEKSRQQHRKYARDWFKKSAMRHPDFINKKLKNDLKEFFEHFGVLSLTANPNSELMWIEYSEDHHGFCVGFKPKIMFEFLGGGGKVEYYDRLPIIYPNDSFEKEHFKQIFCKEKKWKYEEEYRTHMYYKEVASNEDRKIKIPKECYSEVIFGLNSTDETMDEIIEICLIQELNVDFKKVISIENGFGKITKL